MQSMSDHAMDALLEEETEAWTEPALEQSELDARAQSLLDELFMEEEEKNARAPPSPAPALSADAPDDGGGCSFSASEEAAEPDLVDMKELAVRVLRQVAEQEVAQVEQPRHDDAEPAADGWIKMAATAGDVSLVGLGHAVPQALISSRAAQAVAAVVIFAAVYLG